MNHATAEFGGTDRGWQLEEEFDPMLVGTEKGKGAAGRSKSGDFYPRLLIGVIILICAEVFSGASLQIGLWNPWTLVMTYWLYFAHFFFFTTLAIRTGRTSFWALYLWGILFGLYESWITKVIWYGYSGDGKFVMGHVGPFGFSEISMVFIFHPVMSFILPLAVTCVICPPLRAYFPDLAWLTDRSRVARVVQMYLVASLAPVVALNSGGPANLAGNVAFLLVVLAVLWRLARPGLAASDGRSLVAFERRGFFRLCLYLALLYELTYSYMRPEGLPTPSVQLLTLGFYAIAIAGLWLHRRREPVSPHDAIAEVGPEEPRLVLTLLGLMLGLGFLLSWVQGKKALFLPVVGNFVVWTLLGFVLSGAAVWSGVREYRDRKVSFA